MLLPELSDNELFDSLAVETKIKPLSASGIHYIAVDLSPLDYIYSDSINRFIGINRLLLSVAGRLVIIAPHDKVYEILSRAGVDKQIKIVRSLAELKTLSELLLENFPDVKIHKEMLEESNPAPASSGEPKDDFSDLKNILADSLTIADDNFSDEIEAEVKSESPEPISESKPQIDKQNFDLNFDDIFVENEIPSEKEESGINITGIKNNSIDVLPKQEKDIPVSAPVSKRQTATESFDVNISAPSSEQPKTPQSGGLIFSGEETKIPKNTPQPETDYEIYPANETEPQPKKNSLLKIILLLIILLLIAAAAGYFTGIIPLGITKQKGKPAVETQTQESSSPVFDEPAPQTEQTSVQETSPAPKPQAKAKPNQKAKKTPPQKQQQQKTAASHDEIKIFTVPTGAFVYMNGEYIGKSPVTMNKLPYGTLTFRASLDGFEEQEWSVNYNGGRGEKSINLKRREAESAAQIQQTAQQQSTVAAQQQQLEQQQEAARQAQLAAEQSARDEAARKAAEEEQLRQQQLAEQQRAADEQARLKAEQQQEAQRKAEQERLAKEEAQRKAAAEQAAREEAARKAAAEEEARKAAEAAQEATIYFNSMPPRAEIFLNGQKIGETNIAPVKIKPGQHSFEFKKDGKTGSWSGNLRNGSNPSQLIRLQ